MTRPTAAGPHSGAAVAATRSGLRMDSLTGLRFIAAALVFVAHVPTTAYFANQNINTTLFRLFHHVGTSSVTFFFVLSGFVMTVAMRPGDTPGLFIRRRLVKIYPNHLVTFVIAGLMFMSAFTAARAIPNFFLVQAWIPRIDVFFSINPVAWTLSCELLFYVLFPFIMPALRRIRPERLWYWAIGVVAAICLVWFIAARLVPANPPLQFPPLPVGLYQYWIVYIFPPARLLEFVLGILLARIVLSGRWISVGMLPCVGLVLASYVVADQVPSLVALTVVSAVPFALLVAAAGWTDLTNRPSAMRGKVMVWLGEISFAFYLVHSLVLFGTRPWLGAQRFFSVPTSIGIIVSAFVISMIGATLLYRLVERPMVRRFSNPRNRPAAGRPAPVPVPATAEVGSRHLAVPVQESTGPVS